jgi:hypothetical protein
MHTHSNDNSEGFLFKRKPCSRKVSSRQTRKDTGQSSENSSTLKCDRVESLLHGLKIILKHHGAPSRVLRSFYKQAYEYLSVPSEEIFIKRAKDLMLVPMSRYLRNELPEEPDVRFAAKGAWLRWSRVRIRSFRSRNTHLWFSFLQGKRAASPVSPEIVLMNFEKHRRQMLAPDPIRDDEEGNEFLDDIMDVIGPVIGHIRRKIRPSGRKTFLHPEQHTYSASEHAALEGSRKNGGQKGYLRNLEYGTDSPMYIPLHRGDLESMQHHIGIRERDNRLVVNPVTEVRINSAEKEFLLERISTYDRQLVTEKLIDGAWLTELESRRTPEGALLWQEPGIPKRSTLSAVYPEMPPLEARVEAVLEPLKVRTISKGPAVEYDGAKPIQKLLHSTMRKMSPFRLIGRPFRTTDLVDIRRAQEQIGSTENHFWLSIDYSSATDGLSASLSAALLEGLLTELSLDNPGYFRMLQAVLAPHRISYPKVANTQLEDVDQQNGQLMGSPLSFPILCLANLALYLMVRRRTRPDARLRDLLEAVLINGDDMLYIGTEEEWKLHHELGERFGLAMSPGKAYKHQVYANVNSICVHYDLRWESTPLVIPFLNAGLLLGNHKVLGKVESHGTSPALKSKFSSSIALSNEEIKVGAPVSSCFDEVVRGALPGREADVAKMYLSIHSSALRRESKGRNLFLPTSVGGLGQTRPLGIRKEITPQQTALVLEILLANPHKQIACRPYNRGFEVNEVQDLVLEPLGLSVLPEEESGDNWLKRKENATSYLRRAMTFGVATVVFRDAVY